MGARETALNALIACRKDGAWSNGVLKEYILRDRLDRRDAALATRLCYGVLQNRNKLDWYLKQLLTGKIRDLHPVIHDILHLGLYQIYELDKVSDNAAVNESVDLAKKYCKKQRFAPGLVNGVLRNAVQTKSSLKEPKSLEDIYSHPWELISLLRAYVGKDRIEMMLKANNDTPATVIQVNTLKTTARELTEKLQTEGVTARPHGWLKDCLVLSNTGALEQLPSFKEGAFYVQDAAAKLSVLCAEIPAEELNVLDCCAAPGGKSFAAAMALGGKGHITSCDVHAHKTELIANGAERLGLTNITARQQDATQDVPQWHDQMDVVIADVPCSGYGIIRKKPDIRYKNPADMADLPELQLRILKKQAEYVKPGGMLLYSTCTLVRAENEGVVEKFLAENGEFTTEPLPLPDNFPKNESGMLALVPGEYDTDGFFICRLRRKQ
ncbi:MAG: 16S rRNA (cytosine(967)-C(5))-methyltransferase RsmB [Oscillospiraceae bacterium]|nr:16S rRNA (cytosine(967)-C(5))-methyltransferase RsmB [Oscillospiraceae bacterium]